MLDVSTVSLNENSLTTINQQALKLDMLIEWFNIITLAEYCLAGSKAYRALSLDDPSCRPTHPIRSQDYDCVLLRWNRVGMETR